MGELKNISQRFGTKVVLDRLNLSIHPGGSWGIFGENGAGKTSLARLLAGLEKPTSGDLALADLGRPILVQQDFVVWPHLSVRENVSIACKGPHRSDSSWADRWLDEFDLLPLAKTAGGHLSYGQQQRLSLARAFASGASFFIFDEVFSGLDAISHLPLLWRVKACLAERNATSVWISHDWSEISMMCDQVAVLGNSRVLQTGAPSMVYQKPASLQVARMTGATNILSWDEWEVVSPMLTSPFDVERTPASHVLLRPESLSLTASPVRGRFLLEREWFLAPGYLQQIRCENALSLQVFSIDPWAEWSEGAIQLKTEPCVITSS